ncbi:unnamed protein product [Ranitomeya imitator]|uniref:Helicase ATP-binding domain-containing protein n=1 Tax=Ranitomeya imitator TaxID=111125 RepID=A0ABN9MKD5_9NEOB|nr:unnamed protein product [Ranitomeya imitator]
MASHFNAKVSNFMARTHDLCSLGADTLVQDWTQFQLLYIFFSTSPPDIQSGEEDQARGSSNLPNRTGLAQTYMVRRHHTTYSRRPLASPLPPRSSITRPVLPPELRGSQFDSVALETWVLTQAGLSPYDIGTMIRARKPASAKIYYCTWCKSRGQTPLPYSLPKVLGFLQSDLEARLSLGSLKSQISVILYHGTPQERLALSKRIGKREGTFQVHPVVITSFEIAMNDRRILQHKPWKYMILDEGHRIKNMNCRLIRELKQFRSDNKLLLTGTPLQNNLAELWSLLNFLLPDVFDDLQSFESWFDITGITQHAEDLLAKEREQNILHMLHQILTPFLLRRLKCDVALEVPPKREVVVYAPLTKKQETFYTAIVNRTIEKMLGQDKSTEPVINSKGKARRKSRKIVDYRERDTGNDIDRLINHMQQQLEQDIKERHATDEAMPVDAEVHLNMRNTMMVLRKCCSHPYLIEYPLDPFTQEFKIDEDLIKSSGKFLVLDRMLPEMKKRGHKVLIFSQMTSMLDILMDYCYYRKFKFCRLDGSMSFTERDENVRFDT